MWWFGSDDIEAMLSSKTSSTPTVSCSPRWVVYPNMGGHGTHSVAASTQAGCLNACVDDPYCVAVAWTSGCWIHHQHRPRYHRDGITEFAIVRKCYFKSSTWPHHLFLQIFCSSVLHFTTTSLIQSQFYFFQSAHILSINQSINQSST